MRVTTSGGGLYRYAIFEPAGDAGAAPIVLFLHGWDGINPKYYGAWIDYLVRQGQVVLFLEYQTSKTKPLPDVVEVAHQAYLHALDELTKPGHVQINRQLVAAIGYSLGASVAIDLAASGGFPDLPRIGGLVLANPADWQHVPKPVRQPGTLLANVGKLPPDIRVAVVIADQDPIAEFGKVLYMRLCHVAPDRRGMVLLHGEVNGTLTLRADHVAPSAYSRAFDYDLAGARVQQVISSRPDPWLMPSVDALDIFGYWKIADSVLDVVFGRSHVEAAFGDGAAVRFSGLGPDGKPLTPATTLGAECSSP